MTASFADRIDVHFVADRPERLAVVARHPDAGVVTESLPLRANLSVLENIALVPRYRRNLDEAASTGLAWRLLDRVGFTDCAMQRDPDLDHEQRFVTKLLQAVLLEPPLILIDRPALLLPDTSYPTFLDRVLGALDGEFDHCTILDYAWNAPLYPPRASAISA